MNHANQPHELNEDSLAEKILDIINRNEKRRKEEQYRDWCNYLASLPEDLTRILKDGLIAEIELRPSRWIQHGLDLIHSRRAAGTIQLSNGFEGPDLRSYLPYPVFQMGAEVFLKGMWLYQHPECRDCEEDSHITQKTREHFREQVKGMSHDLIDIIEQVKVIAVYSQDPHLSRFLRIVTGIVREFYLPVSLGKGRWAEERYPKRFYNDATMVGRADSFSRYPDQRHVARLFEEAAHQVEVVWQKPKRLRRRR